MSQLDLPSLKKELTAGNRRALAKAVTLVESELPHDRDLAEALLTELMSKTGNSIRLGISGAPGVGKSTFIEAFGKTFLESGHKLAVLTIDPSSPVAGGSILGDKTRMETLANEKDVFIRPSPSKGNLGGVARRTREAILLCEAAGFDRILVETVGVGQSEITAASMVDVFLMLHLPNAGDELQGIKKGILELADLIIVTKADGPTEKAAHQAQLQLQQALHLVRSQESWNPPVLCTSSITSAGLKEAYDTIEKFIQFQKKHNHFSARRTHQLHQWFDQEILSQLKDWLTHQDQSAFKENLAKVESGQLPASLAAKNALIFKDELRTPLSKQME